ncbi:MAG TPA: STAS domain-containing protein [Acidobacteriaceae bacterium]|nr:STAS domain-containing protein [Acidobacteriaceae bacterium]
MATASEASFHFDVAESKNDQDWRVFTVTCHGRLTSATGESLHTAVKRLIEQGGHILIDCADVSFVDSSGLGVLVGLKVSAISKGYCTLELVNLSPRLSDLLNLTKLTQLFSR